MPVTIREQGGRARRRTHARGGRHAPAPLRPLELRRRTRRFIATAEDGRTAVARVRTPSCAKRLAVVMPRRAASAAPCPPACSTAGVLAESECASACEPPGGQPSAVRRLPAGRQRSPARAVRSAATRRLAGEPAHRLRARPGRRARHQPGGGLSVLATGDSMIQRLDTVLLQKLVALGGARAATPATRPASRSPPCWTGELRAPPGRFEP